MERRVLTANALSMLLAVSEMSVMAQPRWQRLMAESAEQLARDPSQRGIAVRGTILFTQQNLGCTKCHVPAAAVPARSERLNDAGAQIRRAARQHDQSPPQP